MFIIVATQVHFSYTFLVVVVVKFAVVALEFVVVREAKGEVKVVHPAKQAL